MIIGVDFDNTIICYDHLFHRVAREQGMIPEDLPADKQQIRDYLRRTGREDLWTEMQGYVYGERIVEAEPFPDVREFFLFCRERELAVCIVSHKTRHPYLGRKQDLHAAAYKWLTLQGFFDPDRLGLSRARVFFELTKEEKINRIAALQCTHFIDDLPEFLSEKSFPPAVRRFLFDPRGNHLSGHPFPRIASWRDIRETFTTLLDVAPLRDASQ